MADVKSTLAQQLPIAARTAYESMRLTAVSTYICEKPASGYAVICLAPLLLISRALAALVRYGLFTLSGRWRA